MSPTENSKIGWTITEAWTKGRFKALLAHIKLSIHWRRVYTLHCWADARDEDWNSYTCMRAAGHFGAHDFQPDGEVMVSFPPIEAQP